MIKGISADLKKDEVYFKGTKICLFLKILYALAPAPPSSVLVLLNKRDLYLKELELSVVTSTISTPASFKGCSSLQNWYKKPTVF